MSHDRRYRILIVGLAVCSYLFSNIDLYAAQENAERGNSASISCLVSAGIQDKLDSAKVDSFFQRLSIKLDECRRPELYYEIYRWYKTCYRYSGSTEKGIDCSHFVNMLYDKIYNRKLENSAASIFTQCKILKNGISKAKEGDLLFFKIKSKRISHVGIYLQDGLFVHASTKAGVIISDISEKYYKKHFYKAGRIKHNVDRVR